MAPPTVSASFDGLTNESLLTWTSGTSSAIRLAKDHPGDRLKRQDALYDFIIEIDHNTRPRIAGRGSAVFVHVARPGFAPTAGCVALKTGALKRLLARVGPRTRIVIG
jgi:L,D-peptidoglycan transpeptidase YkuD (ErfK/YbiS/YcfS/YnhG family)